MSNFNFPPNFSPHQFDSLNTSSNFNFSPDFSSHQFDSPEASSTILSPQLQLDPAFSPEARIFNPTTSRSNADSISHAIATANHSVLVQSKNATYLQVCQHLLNAQKDIDRLKKENHTLFTEKEAFKNAHMTLANSVPHLLSNSNSLANPSSSLALSAPVPTDWPKESDFSREQLIKIFWSKSSWTNRNKGVTNPNKPKGKQGRSRASEGINVKMLYVVDKEGTPIDGHRAITIRAVARSIWGQLSAKGAAPLTWMADSTLPVVDHYRHEMQQRCEELRLCAGGWKADQIAIDYYSSWRKGRMKKGKFNHTVKQEEQDGEDDDDEEEDDDDEKENKKNDDIVETVPILKRKSKTLERPLPKKHKGENVTAVKTTEKVGAASKIKINNPLARKPMGTAPISTPSTNTLAVATTPVSSASEGSSIPSMTSGSVVGVSAATGAPVSTTLDALVTTLDEPATTLDEPATALDAPATELDEPATEPDAPAIEPDAPATELDASALPGSEVTLHPTTSVDNLPGLVPSGSVDDTAMPAPTQAAQGQGKSKKKPSAADRPVEPGEKITPRNICIEEWRANNPNGTQGQFKMYWDRLSTTDMKRLQKAAKDAKAAGLTVKAATGIGSAL